jgi:hypothetical protein
VTARYFCDGCGTELTTEEAARRLQRARIFPGHHIAVKVTVALDGGWNSGHVCHACILRVMNEGVPAGDDGIPIGGP